MKKQLHYLKPEPLDKFLVKTKQTENIELIAWTRKFEDRVIWTTAMIELFETYYNEN
jgi:hypothetical protein